MMDELTQRIKEHINHDGIQPTAIPFLYLFRSRIPYDRFHSFYEASVCFVAQGEKQVTLGDTSLIYGVEDYLLVAVELPIVSSVRVASPQHPHFALHITLDTILISDLMIEMGMDEIAPSKSTSGLSIGKITPLLRNTLIRLVSLLDTPEHIPVLAPLLLKEIYYHLLVGDEGYRLCEITLENGKTQRMARVIQHLRESYDRKLDIDQIADDVGLSVSSLYHQFKAITGTSPLQFQKQVRLQEARRMLIVNDIDAASVSFEVGYESPSQFSREYHRLFGAPPRQDVTQRHQRVTQG